MTKTPSTIQSIMVLVDGTFSSGKSAFIRHLPVSLPLANVSLLLPDQFVSFAGYLG